MERIIIYFRPDLENTKIHDFIKIINLAFNLLFYYSRSKYFTLFVCSIMIYFHYLLPHHETCYYFLKWKEDEYNYDFSSTYHWNIKTKYRKAYEIYCKFDLFFGYVICLTSYSIRKVLPFFDIYSFIIY